MANRRKIDTQTEIKIVARIARGDSYQEIKDDLAKDGVDISLSGITDVKQRNSLALEQIKGSLVQHEASKSARILDKAKKQLEGKLDNAERIEQELSEAKKLYDDGDIDFKEYLDSVDQINKRGHISIKDLVTVSKEMFNQSQIEAGKPTSITENPEQQKENLMTLLKAINEKDDVGMIKAIFPDA